MNLNEIIFINNLPTLDLHGFDRQTARVAINDFINDNLKMKNNFIVIIHGIGTGILMNAVRNYLQKDKRVLEYKLDYMNPGCTLVVLKVDNY